MDAEAVRQLRMGLGWVFLIRGDAGWVVGLSSGSCCIDWIVLYQLDRIVSDGIYRIGWIVSGNTGFYALAVYWLKRMDGTDGLDGTLVGRGWDGPTLAPVGTGAPPLVP